MSNYFLTAKINFEKLLAQQVFTLSFRLSQSRSHGFLVWCGRTRHERSLARSFALRVRRSYDLASRSLSRYALKSSTCEQVYLSLSILSSFCICCAIYKMYTFFCLSGYFIGFTQFGNSSYCFNFMTQLKKS